MSYIKSFKINKLYGYRTIEITQNADCIILVGENGSGKSTIMNCLYFVLSKKFDELVKIDFESLEIIFHTGKKFVLRHTDIIPIQPIRLSMTERRFVNQLNEQLKLADIKTIIRIFENEHIYERQIENIESLLKTKKVFLSSRFTSESFYNCVKAVYTDFKLYMFEKTVEELSKYLLPSNQVFHLTTYRRVETSACENTIEDTTSEIAYGMRDVDMMLKSFQNEINERNKVGFNNMMISLLNKLVLKEDHKDIKSLNIEKVKIVLSRLGAHLSDDLRDTIIRYCQNHKEANSELDYLIEELIKLYEQQEELDNAIVQFYTRCNKYLNGKKFEYDVANVQIMIRSEHNGVPINLEALSSGEKQMVGLMAKMYLSKEKEFIVLIDEPELSLSIKWQETILEDMVQSGKVKYLMAVTHSPFIYNNSLQKYAVGMSNFVKDVK